MAVDPIIGNGPILQILNKYVYVINNPLVWIDLFGLEITKVTINGVTKTINTNKKSDVIDMLSIFDISARFNQKNEITVYNYYHKSPTTFQFIENMSIQTILESAGIHLGVYDNSYFYKISCNDKIIEEYFVTVQNKYQHKLGIDNSIIDKMLLDILNEDSYELLYLANIRYLGGYGYDPLYSLYILKYHYDNYKKLLTDLNVPEEAIALIELSYRTGKQGFTLEEIDTEQRQRMDAQRQIIIAMVMYPLMEVATFGTNNNSIVNTDGGLKTPVIGRMNDMRHIGKNEYRVADLLPDQGSPQSNWKQNSSVLRSIMNKGYPIRDATLINNNLDPKLGIVGTQNANTFLHMERNLLYEHGWRYNNGFWILP